MKVQLKVAPRVIVEAEGETQADVFEQLASLQEVFGQEKCGKCGCEVLHFTVREVDGNKYFELRCTDPKCRAKLAFGQHKKGGGLFPKRKDDQDKYLPDGGWKKWDKTTQTEV